MATAREKTMAATKAPVKPEENEVVEGTDTSTLEAQIAELRGMVAGLTAGLAAAKSSGPRAQQDVEPGQDDPRRNIVEEGFEPVTFRARGRALRIVRVPATRWTTLNGEAQHAGGISYDFAPTGDFTARNSNVADFLRKRPMFNVEFWEVGNEPHAAPDPSVVLDKILKATMELDQDALEEIAAKERGSHKRRLVLDAVNAAQRRIKAASE
jgi:hypothetical protein